MFILHVCIHIAVAVYIRETKQNTIWYNYWESLFPVLPLQASWNFSTPLRQILSVLTRVGRPRDSSEARTEI